jgi:hypothetical protein
VAEGRNLITHRIQPSLDRVTRILVAFLLAISMAIAPASAFAQAAADVPMANMPGGMAHHDKMSCCGPDCAVTSPAAVLAVEAVDLPAVEPCSIPAAAHVPGVLPSIGPAATDPPPRTTIS